MSKLQVLIFVPACHVHAKTVVHLWDPGATTDAAVYRIAGQKRHEPQLVETLPQELFRNN